MSAGNYNKPQEGGKDWLVALLLSIFLGWLGVDRFYLGHIGTGVLKLLTWGGVGIWWLIDIILIAANQMTDARGNPLIQHTVAETTFPEVKEKEMSTPMSDQELYERARKIVEEKKGFYTHLAVYVLVNTFLIIIWAFPSGGGYPWFLWPLGGWGIGIIFHFLGVFVFPRQTEWERRAIEKEVEHLKKEMG
jgi:TM2 domain-containing membrane protein YozV